MRDVSWEFLALAHFSRGHTVFVERQRYFNNNRGEGKENGFYGTLIKLCLIFLLR